MLRQIRDELRIANAREQGGISAAGQRAMTIVALKSSNQLTAVQRELDNPTDIEGF